MDQMLAFLRTSWLYKCNGKLKYGTTLVIYTM